MKEKKTAVVNPEEQQAKLKQKIVEAREVVGELQKDETAGRYQLGIIVKELKNKSSYGASAVKRLAEELVWEQSSLYDCGRVVEKFSVDVVTDTPLSFSHFVVLAKMKDDVARAEALHHCLTEKLTVQELRRRTKKAGKQKEVDIATCIQRAHEFLNKVVGADLSGVDVYDLEDKLESLRKSLDLVTQRAADFRSVPKVA